MNIMAILGSSRRNGNTEYLVDRALSGVAFKKRFLLDYQINPIIDKRHTSEGFSKVDDDYERLFAEFMKQDIIIFATPLYWFGMSGQLKLFFDRWSQYMRDDKYDFKHLMSRKKAYVIVTGDNPNPKIAALPLIQQFQHIFTYTGVQFADYIIGQGNKPEEIKNDSFSLHTATSWNKEFTEVTKLK
ncbi:flavodoxin family protein [Salipaludibacillus sp. HK11]|uniref:flavodoxin family protein n=1 Tax=Salipaludibacillus sp. HK11 TaxID=3394320 RepID=UPI0039FC9F4A